MDLPEQPELLPPRLPAPALAPETPDYLEQELFEFKRLFHALLVALLAPVLAGTIYFAKQMRLVRGELAEYRPMVHRLAAEYRQKEPRMKEFAAAMQAYGTTHPDFQPVVQRYRGLLSEYFVTPILLNSSPLRGGRTNAPPVLPRR
jgi:hypothetical protein